MSNSSETGESTALIIGSTVTPFRIDRPTLELLESLDEPIAVVSVCGQLRTGKSFILNQLFERSHGFRVANGPEPCTHYLDLWSSPLWRLTADGTSYNVLFVDVEAIDSYPTMGKLCLMMTSLAVLLSSTFIYNQMGSINDVALHLLSRAVELSKHIVSEASKDRDAGSQLQLSPPNLLLLLRDFHKGLLEDNNVITPQDYLEHTLGRVELGGDSIAAARNKMRESIRDFFPNRECCTLDYPVIDVNDLGRLNQISPERLRPEFRDGLTILKTTVFERTRPKKVGDTLMTGPMLVRILKMFLDVINSGAVPWSCQSKEDAECLIAYKLGEESFMNMVNSRYLNEKKLLEKELSDSLESFDKHLGRAGFGNGPLHHIYRMCLKSALENKIVELQEAAAARSACDQLANRRAECNPFVQLANKRVDTAHEEFFGFRWIRAAPTYRSPRTPVRRRACYLKKETQHTLPSY